MASIKLSSRDNAALSCQNVPCPSVAFAISGDQVEMSGKLCRLGSVREAHLESVYAPRPPLKYVKHCLARAITSPGYSSATLGWSRSVGHVTSDITCMCAHSARNSGMYQHTGTLAVLVMQERKSSVLQDSVEVSIDTSMQHNDM